MSRLLSANFARLVKDRTFRVCTCMMAFYGIFMVLMGCYDLHKSGYAASLIHISFGYAEVMGVLAATFTSQFLGVEYSDGTIRNKLIVGHRRHEIYLSNLLTVSAAVLLMNAAYAAAVLLSGIPLLGMSGGPDPSVLLTLVLVTILMDAAYAAAFTLYSMLNRNKVTVTAVSIMGALLAMIFSGYVQSRLIEPKTYVWEMEMTEEGEILPYEEETNPYYLEGTTREVFEFLNDFLPSGQALQIEGEAIDGWQYLALYSCLFAAGLTGVGVAAFFRKDIN